MEVGSDIVRLSKREQAATGLPAEFPLFDARDYAYVLTEGRIPALCEDILQMQADSSQPNQQEMVQKCHDHFCASLVARGLERAIIPKD